MDYGITSGKLSENRCLTKTITTAAFSPESEGHIAQTSNERLHCFILGASLTAPMWSCHFSCNTAGDTSLKILAGMTSQSDIPQHLES